MSKKCFSRLLYAGLLLALAACQTGAESPKVNLSSPNDPAKRMSLTTGSAQAVPLWAYCATSQPSEFAIVAECDVPRLSRLAIGHAFLGNEQVLHEAEWSELVWELTLDGQRIHLEDFGTYDIVMPVTVPNPSFVREVFVKVKAWDVVLNDLQPGGHTLEGRLHTGANDYSWVANLQVRE